MKLSRLMHLASILLALAAGAALVGAWIAGDGGRFFGLSQPHLFSDAIVLALLAVAASSCTLVRLKLEGERPGSSPLI